MKKSYVEKNAISLNPMNKMSKDEEKIKCQGNVRSRYLKEHIGSCHNLCKFGRKHESEHDKKHLTSRRFMRNNFTLETVSNLVKRSTSINSDTTKSMKQKIRSEKDGTFDNLMGANMLNPLTKHRRAISSPQFIIPGHSRRYSGSLAKKIGFFDNFINNALEAHSPTHRSIEIIPRNLEQKIQPLVEDDVNPQIQSKKIVESKNNIKVDIGALSLKTKRNEIKSKPLAKSKSTPIKRNILKQKNSSTSTEVDSRGNVNIFEKVLSNQKESSTLKTLKEIQQKDMAFRKQSASSNPQSNNLSASLLSRKTNSSATLLMPLNVRNSQLNTSRSMNGRMNWEEESLHINETSEVGETKLLNPERTSISSTKPSHGTVSLKARKSRFTQQAMLKNSGKATDDCCDFKEKVFKTIGTKLDGKDLKSEENLSKKLGRHAFDSAVSDTSKYSSNEKIQRKYKCSITTKEEDKRRARRTPVAKQPAESSSAPYKLTFQRGKMIEVQTTDTGALRKIKFMRGRILGEKPRAEVKKRSFRKKRDIGGSNEHYSEVQSAMLKKANLASKLGLLEYQDALGKKEFRALFNEVIEETASKLVQTRKSKVKALVGAFETVISLQESEPASVV